VRLNKNLILTLLLIIVITGGMISCSNKKLKTTNETVESSTTNSTNNVSTSSYSEGYGAACAIKDTNLTLEEMLTYAIQDEYLAHGEYDYILKTFGDQKPFSNIIKAEEKHIAELKLIFQKYEIVIPLDLSKDHLIVPTSIKNALETGVQAEIDNIAMYKRFLEQKLPDDVRATFVFLMNGSESHLSAFRKNLN